MMRILAGIVVLAGVAHADDKPCIPPDVRPGLDVVAGKPRVCAASACWTVDEAGAMASAPQPAPTTIVDDSNVSVQVDGGKVKLCFADVCKPAGKRVGRLLVAQRDRGVVIGGGPRTTQRLWFTPDFAAVVIDGQAFSIATDKPLVLKSPPEFAQLRFSRAKLVDVRGVGKILVATWSDCDAAPCTYKMSVAVTSRGKIQSPWFPQGTLHQLDDDRVVVFGNDQSQTQVTALSASGKPIGGYQVNDLGARGTKLDASTFVVLTAAGSYQVSWIDIAKDEVTLRTRRTLPTCARKP
jgi:hypothetical protein